MRVFDILSVKDDFPFWINSNTGCFHYEDKSECIIERNMNVKYITVDGNGELTLEVSWD